MSESRGKALLVGADGVIGRHVLAALTPHYEIVRAGLDGPDLALDLGDTAQLVRSLGRLGTVDAIISTAGRARFMAMESIEPLDIQASVYGVGLRDKLMGQVNLALAGRRILVPNGSITLTSGTTSEDPVLGGSSLSMVNGALEHWVRAAATEMRGVRINVVSPSLVEGTPAAAIEAFPGFELVSGEKIARAYIRCLESGLNGFVLRV